MTWAYASVGVALIPCTVIALVEDNGWSWPLFAWGALLGPTWALAAFALTRYGERYIARSTGASGGDVAAARKQSWETFKGLYPVYAVAGLPFGFVSAATLTVWADLAGTLYEALAVVLLLVALPRLARRAAARGGQGAQ
jgi:hypothetical protein